MLQWRGRDSGLSKGHLSRATIRWSGFAAQFDKRQSQKIIHFPRIIPQAILEVEPGSLRAGAIASTSHPVATRLVLGSEPIDRHLLLGAGSLSSFELSMNPEL